MIEAVPEITEDLPGDFVALHDDIAQAWEKLAYTVSNPELLFQLLEDISKNPLCIAVTGALWVVLGVKLFAHIVSSVRSRS